MKGLFARKPLHLIMQEPELERHKLKRVLGPWGLISLGIGVVIGAGIFVLSGQAAANYAGPAIVLSFIISAIGCALAGLCYAEFASMIPISGSAYTYADKEYNDNQLYNHDGIVNPCRLADTDNQKCGHESDDKNGRTIQDCAGCVPAACDGIRQRCLTESRRDIDVKIL